MLSLKKKVSNWFNDVNNRIFWLSFALLIKVVIIILFLSFCEKEKFPAVNGFIFIQPDIQEHLYPADNYHTYGIMTYEGSSTPYAGRMPGYTFPYLLLRYVFDQNAALSILILLQVIFAAFSTYYLSHLAFFISRSKPWFYFVFFSYALANYFFVLDLQTVPESLSVSCYIFFLYNIYIYFKDQSNKALFWSGFFITWLFFLRGFLAVYFLPITILLSLYLIRKKIDFKEKIIAYLLFFSFFIVVESAWILRNYSSFHKFIPLQTGYVPGQSIEDYQEEPGGRGKIIVVHLREVIAAWGGDCTSYFQNAEMAWFNSTTDSVSALFNLPDRIFFNGFDRDSLEALKRKYHYAFANIENDKELYSFVDEANRIHRKFKTENPYVYYVLAPMHRLRQLLIKNVVTDWPGAGFEESHKTIQVMKLSSLLFYYVVLIGGLISLAICFFIRHLSYFRFLLIGNTLLLLLLFAKYIELVHFRYFYSGSISLMLLISLVVYQITNKKHT